MTGPKLQDALFNGATRKALEAAGTFDQYRDYSRPDESNEQYHADRSHISKSGLDLIARSPAHFRHAQDNPDEPTPALIFGQAFHAWMENPDAFFNDFAIKPEGIDRRTKNGKIQWAAFCEESAGKTIISEEEFSRIKAMGRAVEAHPVVATMIHTGQAYREHSLRWTDDKSGVACKCRPDLWKTMSDDRMLVADYKTTLDASPAAFSRDLMKYRYGLQAAFYSAGVRAATGLEVAGFIFVVAEKNAPHNVACYVASDEVIRHGEMLMRRDLEKYAECLERDEWPGYSDQLEEVCLPAWAGKELEAWEGAA